MYNSVFICESIANKLKCPEYVMEVIDNSAEIKESFSEEWPYLSFREGLPGICCFYSGMHEAFPNSGWNNIVDNYIKVILDLLKKRQMATCSLFNGMSGLGLSIFFASKNRRDYKNLMKNIDDWLISEIRRSYLDQYFQYKDKEETIPLSFYNFFDGIGGIIYYLLIRKDNPYIHNLAKECIEMLSELLLCNKLVENDLVPAWYISQKELFFDKTYESGGFISNASFGISSSLAVLSIAMLEGVSTLNIVGKAVQHIASWLMEKYSNILKNGSWNTFFSLRKIEPLSSNSNKMELSWLNGWPPIARSLYLAGKALKDQSLMKFASDFFFEFIKKDSTFKFFGTSFGTGIAGFIITAKQMARDLQSPILFKTIFSLEQELQKSFNPDFAFGYKQSFFNHKEKEIWIDAPGFIYGSAGIGLALLIMQEKCKYNFFW